VVGGDEQRAFFRRVPSAVSVVTVDVGGYRTGITVGSLVSLALEPPLIGMSINREAQTHELLRDSMRFGVSLLAGDQERVAERFAMSVPPIVLWDGVDVRNSDGPPLLAGAAGWLVCSIRDEVAAGSHTFFVSAVESVELGDASSVLVYVGSRYRAL
jgi:4-nitrophenol 2-monooxygenase / 4-nitrocatechol 4-monooxygenase, reductase component